MLNVKNVFRTAGLMIIFTLTAKLAGMYREVLFASLYGTSDTAVAFSTASRIPLLFFDIALGAAVSSSFIPVFNEYLQKGRRDEAIRYSNTFINLIFLFTVAVCAVCMIFSGTVVGLVAPRLEPEVKALSAQLVIILFPTMIFSALAFSLAGLLQSLGEFNVPAAISLVSNGFMVIYLLVAGKKFGIKGIAAAMMISWGFQVLVQIPSLIKKKYSYRFVLDLKCEGIKKSAVLALPILISSWVQPINSLVNMNLASGLNGGAAMAALDYANKLYIIFVGVLTYAVSNLIFPTISRLAVNEDKTEFKELVLSAVRVIMLIIFPVMVLFLMLRVPIIQFVYERGEFNAESTALTAKALLFYSMGMVGYGMYEILNKAFYALQDGKTPMRVSVCAIAVNILLSLTLVKVFHCGLEGLALAASIAAVMIAVSLLIIIHRKFKMINKDFLINFVKLIICSAAMGAAVFASMQLVPCGQSTLSRLIYLAVNAAVGCAVYLLMTYIFRVKEIINIKSIIKGKEV